MNYALDLYLNLSMNMQAKLLSAIEKRAVTKVGSDKEIPVDVRMISATNQDLKSLVKNNQFREDLLYRINTIEIEIPPLRGRGDDITEIANHYLKVYSLRYNKLNLKFDDVSISRLQKYHWPGNVRELRHTIEKVVILSDSEIIAKHL